MIGSLLAHALPLGLLAFAIAVPVGAATATWPQDSGVDQYGAWADLSVTRGGTVVTQRLRKIASGTYLRGSPPEEPGHLDGESQHQVTISRDFYIADTECSQALWQAVTGSLPLTSTGNPIPSAPAQPVTWVSWDMATDFCQELSDLIAVEARLPTEAEWEYAARAGTTGPFSLSDDQITTDHLAVRPYGSGANADPYIDADSGESRGGPVDVGALPANPWGLYEVHGNVLEWVYDQKGAYPTGAVTDPVNDGDPTTDGRMQRGGDYKKGAQYARSARRLSASAQFARNSWGFRFVLVVTQPNTERRIDLTTTAPGQTYAQEGTAGDNRQLPVTFIFPDKAEDRLFQFNQGGDG